MSFYDGYAAATSNYALGFALGLLVDALAVSFIAFVASLLVRLTVTLYKEV